MPAAHLTVRNLPQPLAAALEKEKRRRGTSLNQTVIELLEQSLGVKGDRTNRISVLGGKWTEAEHGKFLSGIKPFEEVDSGLWK